MHNEKPILEYVMNEDQQSVCCKHFNQKNFDFPWHYHNQWELTYIKKGSGIAYTNTMTRHFRENELVLIPPNVPHCWISSSQSDFESVYSSYIQWNDCLLSDDWLSRSEFKAIKSLLEQCKKGVIFKNSSSFGKKISKLENTSDLERLLGLISLLNDSSYATDRVYLDDNITMPVNLLDDMKIKKILHYISQNYNEKITLEDIASQHNMCSTSFCKYFKRVFNKTFTQFLSEYRINSACNLLHTTKKSIDQIAYECGYGNMSLFYRSFKKVACMTPKEYRSKLSQT